MTSSAEEAPLKPLALDAGDIRGLSELPIRDEVMHRPRVEENVDRKGDDQAPLNTLPKPCDYFDLIDAKVTQMDPNDAKRLLLDLCKAEESDENAGLAELIVQELHCVAFAVFLAGAFIQCCSSLSKYQELYQCEHDNLFQSKEVHQGQDQYELTVYTTWRLICNKLDPPARSFLQACSFLHHKGVSEQMFQNAALSQIDLEDLELQHKVTQLLNQLGKQDSHWDSEAFQEVVRQLGSYSLIAYDHQNHTYSIHPLMQHWRNVIMETDMYVMQKCVLTIIGLSISWTFNDEDYQYRRTLLKHITNSIILVKLEEISLLVLSHIALVYTEQGLWNDAQALQMVVMERMKQLLEEDHPDTLTSMQNLAVTYINQGNWNDAQALQVVVVEKRKQLLGDNHLGSLTSMQNLAVIYINQGHWNDAQALQVVVMEKEKQLLGENHPGTLISMQNLAGTYVNQGNWNDAQALQMVVMEKSRQLLGEDHPDTLTSMQNLAVTYIHQGQWNNAQALQMVVVERRKKLLGKDHPDTLTSMQNLAVIYTNQGC